MSVHQYVVTPAGVWPASSPVAPRGASRVTVERLPSKSWRVALDRPGVELSMVVSVSPVETAVAVFYAAFEAVARLD